MLPLAPKPDYFIDWDGDGIAGNELTAEEIWHDASIKRVDLFLRREELSVLRWCKEVPVTLEEKPAGVWMNLYLWKSERFYK